MSDVLFIQFYLDFGKTISFCNGFSDTYDLCKSKGDFLWVRQETMGELELPIKKGTIYVSAYFSEHLYQVYKWSIKYPNIKFVVGGPAILSRYKIDKGYFLNNVEVSIKSVEEYFGVSNFSYDWKFDIPNKIINPYKILWISYTLDTSCYWSKCIFCNYYFDEIRKRKYEETKNFIGIKNFIKEFDHKEKMIRLNTPGITPYYIKNFLNKLPSKDVKYDLLMRCSKAENKDLKNVFDNWIGDKPKFKWRLGIEYPVERMLTYMKKGFTPTDILTTLNILYENNIEISVNFMIGWPNLTEKDVFELEKFLDKMPPIQQVSLHRVFCKYQTKLHDVYINKIERKSYVGPFYKGYFPILKEKQFYLNRLSAKLIYDKFKSKTNFTDFTMGILK